MKPFAKSIIVACTFLAATEVKAAPGVGVDIEIVTFKPVAGAEMAWPQYKRGEPILNRVALSGTTEEVGGDVDGLVNDLRHTPSIVILHYQRLPALVGGGQKQPVASFGPESGCRMTVGASDVHPPYLATVSYDVECMDGNNRRHGEGSYSFSKSGAPVALVFPLKNDQEDSQASMAILRVNLLRDVAVD